MKFISGFSFKFSNIYCNLLFKTTFNPSSISILLSVSLAVSLIASSYPVKAENGANCAERASIKETARLTDKRIEIDDGLKIILNNKLQYVLEKIKLKPEIIFTYFVYDDKKIGGKYVEKIGVVKKIDMVEQYVMLIDKTKIPILEIINITGEIFNSMEEE